MAGQSRGCFLASGPCLRSRESGMDRTKNSFYLWGLWRRMEKDQCAGEPGFETRCEVMGRTGQLPSCNPACLPNTLVLTEGHKQSVTQLKEG